MRIAFDLDETLGTPIIVDGHIAGFAVREGAIELLADLRSRHELWLWSVSSRSYLEKVLGFGLGAFFERVISWDDLPAGWKNVDELAVDLLVDDSEHHHDMAARRGSTRGRYLVVPAIGDPADMIEPQAWIRMVREATQ